MALEPGLDLHDWETRWQELHDLAAESPGEALPELLRLTEQMLTERGYDLTEVGDDSDLLRSFLGARDLAAAWEAGTASPGDTAAALENLRDIHDYLVEGRPL